MNRITFILTLFLNSLLAQQKLGNQYFEMAQEKVREQKWEAAKDYLNQCLIAAPSFASGYSLRAEVNEHLKKHTEAMTDYSIAIDLAPEQVDNYLKRGVLAYDLGRYDLARADFKKLLRSQATETNTVYFRQSNNESIDKIFTLQSGIKDMLYNYLGLIETKSSNYSKALHYFDSAIYFNPNSSDYHAHRGIVYLNREVIDSALLEFEKALKINSDHAVSKNNLATIKRKQGRLDEAEKYLREAKAVSQNTSTHFANMALLQMESGRFREAVLNLDSAIVLDPGEGELYLNRGLAKEKANDSLGALRDYNMALRIDSEWPKAWFTQGNYFVKQRQWQKALENYTVAITYDENYSHAYFNRAIVNYQLKKYGQACIDIQSAEVKGMIVESKMKQKFCRE